MSPAHPSDAIEPAIARPGACFEPADDRLYALGWPHLRYLVDGHKDEAKPLAKIGKVFARYGRIWPRGVATRFVRGLAEIDADNNITDPAVLKIAENPAPIAADEARALITKQVVAYGRGNAWYIRELVFQLEAMVGAEPILDAIVTAIESLGAARWAPNWTKTRWDHNPGSIALLGGLLLLRVPKPVATRQKKRLEALYAHGVAKKHPRGENALLTGIDCALHGTEAVARSLEPDEWRYLEWYHFVDDLAVLTDRMNDNDAAQYTPSARHIWLAGGDLIPVHEKHARKVGAAEVPEYIEDIGKFRDPRIVDLMLVFAAKKAAKDAPAAWMRAHAAVARPRLKELAKGSSPKATAAKAALAII